MKTGEVSLFRDVVTGLHVQGAGGDGAVAVSRHHAEHDGIAAGADAGIRHLDVTGHRSEEELCGGRL